ncbi:MAG TPA: hypothetical protein PJ982_18720, partial [Lacipirellulaceae bacterium]|nr:hypothetical protein [Lacipirellulaceae bacterium]
MESVDNVVAAQPFRFAVRCGCFSLLLPVGAYLQRAHSSRTNRARLDGINQLLCVSKPGVFRMRQPIGTWLSCAVIALVGGANPCGEAYAGDFFLPVPNAAAGSMFPGGFFASNTTSGLGMNDGNAGLKTATHGNNGTGFGMWLTDFFAFGGGHTDPSSDAWISFDFGEVVNGIDQMLIWNYNQAGAIARGMRNVDITYSTTGSSGLGNVLYTGLTLNPGTGLDNMASTDTIALGAPGVGINARSIRIT